MAAPSSSLTQPSSRKVFVLVGDSLTQFGSSVALGGWATLLQEAYVRSVDVLNRGLSGYTSRETAQLALPVLQHEWQQHQLDPQLITLCLGANDAALLTGETPQQHVPVDEYAQHIRTIVQFLVEQAPNAKVIVLTPPPVNDAQRLALSSKPGFLDRSFANAQLYGQRCAQVVHDFVEANESFKQRVALIDLFGEISAFGAVELPSFFCDGLHFSARGNKFVFKLITEAIASKWPELSSDTLRWQLPDEHEIHG